MGSNLKLYIIKFDLHKALDIIISNALYVQLSKLIFGKMVISTHFLTIDIVICYLVDEYSHKPMTDLHEEIIINGLNSKCH